MSESVDAAMSYVWKVIPESSLEEKLAAARAATEHAAQLGVTSVQDVSAGNDVGVYQTLLDRGELKTRIYAASPLAAWERLAHELAAVTFKEYGLQDANTLEATQTSIESRAVEEFLYCDQEILLRHLHKETASWIDAYQRESEQRATSGIR